MSERRFVTKRSASQAAIELLFAGDSDEEPVRLDEEDKSFLEEDNEEGAEESAIIDGRNREEENLDIRPTESFSNKWDKTSSLKPNPDFSNCADYDVIHPEIFELSSAFEIFIKVSGLNKLISDIVIPQSKEYAQQKGAVYDVDEEEMRAFLGISILMGLHVLPELRDYWSADEALGVPYVSNIMTLSRFETIRKYLHFSNNWTTSQDDRSGKIDPVLHHFNEHFQAATTPSKAHSIDERMIKFKGHNIMKQ